MYILTNDKNVIIKISETLDYQSNGNPLVDNNSLAISKHLVNNIYENINIEDEVCEDKYCYTSDKGFYENPDYIEYIPEPTVQELQEQIKELKQAIEELKN